MAESPVQVEAPPKVENSNNSNEIPSTAHASVLLGGPKTDPITGRNLGVDTTFSIGDDWYKANAPENNGNSLNSAPESWVRTKTDQPALPKDTNSNGVAPYKLGEAIPPHSEKPYEGSRATSNIGVGDLPPGSKTGYDQDIPEKDSIRSNLPPSSLYKASSAPKAPEKFDVQKEMASLGREVGEYGDLGWQDKLRNKIRDSKWGMALRTRVSNFVKNIPNKKLVLLLPLILAAQHDRAGNISLDQAARATEPPARGAMDNRPSLPTNWMDSEFFDAPTVGTIGPLQSELQVDTEPLQPPVTEGFKGKGPATIEQDFSLAGEKQSLKGITEDQLAQLLNPAYKTHVEEMRSQGKNIDPNEGWAQGTLESFKDKLIEKFGDQLGNEKYDRVLNDLIEQERYVVENYNGPGGTKVGIGEDGDAIIFAGNDKKLNLLDMNSEGKSTIALATKGGYSIPGDENFLDQYKSSFVPVE